MKGPSSAAETVRSTLTIGDVCMRVVSESALATIQNPAYGEFAQHDGDPVHGRTDVAIEVLAVDDLAADPENPSFDSDRAWKLQFLPTGYRLSLHRLGDDKPCAIASSDDGTQEVTIQVDPHLLSGSEDSGELWNPVRYPLDQLLLMNHLAPRGGAIVHAAGVVIQGKAIVLPGRSGAGKSTVARLFVDAGLEDSMLSDDRIILRSGGSKTASSARAQTAPPTAWGTPWPGDARIARNSCAPLGAILFLTQAPETRLSRLSPGAAMRRLMPVVSVPWYDETRGNQVMATCASVAETVPCFELFFAPTREVVDLVTQAVGQLP